MSKLTIEQIVDKFEKHPHYMDSGAGKMSKRWNCTRNDIFEARKIVKAKRKTGRLPKVLIFDIETSPSIVYSFQRFNVNIYIDQVIHDPIVLTWSAKWLYGSEIMSDAVTREEVLSFNDKRVVKSLWRLLDEADIVIAHYGDRFDCPFMNSRFIINGMRPPSPSTSIDTKAVASRHFKFPSNKLDALASYFGLPAKMDTDFSLWAKCMAGEQESLNYMLEYNKQDVSVLEQVYLRLRPYIKNHPNVGLYLESDSAVCANCGGNHLTVVDKDYYTNSGRYSLLRCDCGALSRVRYNNIDKDRKKTLVISSGK